MPPTQTPHRTPLRRVSQGSLFRLSRSNAYPDAPHGLGFIEPAMSEFLEETEALQTNVEGMKHLSDSLATFNESFASWLYVMNMNALTTDWPQVSLDHQAVLCAFCSIALLTLPRHPRIPRFTSQKSVLVCAIREGIIIF